VPGFWHGSERRCAGQIGTEHTLTRSRGFFVQAHLFVPPALITALNGVRTVTTGAIQVPPSLHSCQVGAKKLAQVPFSLVRDTVSRVVDIGTRTVLRCQLSGTDSSVWVPNALAVRARG
jgi:hypothetical protein